MQQKNNRTVVVRLVFRVLSFCRTAFTGISLAAISTLAYSNPSAVERFETTNAILSFKPGSGDLIGVQWKKRSLSTADPLSNAAPLADSLNPYSQRLYGKDLVLERRILPSTGGTHGSPSISLVERQVRKDSYIELRDPA